MEKMNKKGQWQIGVSSGALIAILILLFVFIVLPSFQQTVSYKIQLEKTQVLENENVRLFYTVMNELPQDIEDVEFTYELVGESNSRKEIQLNTLDGGEEYRDSILIFTNNLDKGKYTILTTLTYFDTKELKKESLSLTLGLEIF